MEEEKRRDGGPWPEEEERPCMVPWLRLGDRFDPPGASEMVEVSGRWVTVLKLVYRMEGEGRHIQ